MERFQKAESRLFCQIICLIDKKLGNTNVNTTEERKLEIKKIFLY